MATGSTLNRFSRAYVDGFDMSGFARSIGPLTIEYSLADLTAAMIDEVRGFLPDMPTVSPGTLNALFDNTPNVSPHDVLRSAGGYRNVMVPIGIKAAPAAGDPVFAGAFQQLGYLPVEDSGAIIVNIPFGGWESSVAVNYQKPWGALLHAKAQRSAANTATGIDDNGAASAAGGWMAFQVFSGDGTATLKVQHASTNSNASFADVAGLTSGVIDCSAPIAGVAQAAVTASINRYVRWQITLGTATAITFALAFIRG